nr:hypothetical protein CFP56_63051 [Quercus suber]
MGSSIELRYAYGSILQMAHFLPSDGRLCVKKFCEVLDLKPGKFARSGVIPDTLFFSLTFALHNPTGSETERDVLEAGVISTRSWFLKVLRLFFSGQSSVRVTFELSFLMAARVLAFSREWEKSVDGWMVRLHSMRALLLRYHCWQLNHVERHPGLYRLRFSSLLVASCACGLYFFRKHRTISCPAICHDEYCKMSSLCAVRLGAPRRSTSLLSQLHPTLHRTGSRVPTEADGRPSRGHYNIAPRHRRTTWRRQLRAGHPERTHCNSLSPHDCPSSPPLRSICPISRHISNPPLPQPSASARILISDYVPTEPPLDSPRRHSRMHGRSRRLPRRRKPRLICDGRVNRLER